MSSRWVIAGIILIVIALSMLIPGWILKAAGAEITDESEAGEVILDQAKENFNNPTSQQVIDQTKQGLKPIKQAPYYVLIVGILILITGFFIPD